MAPRIGQDWQDELRGLDVGWDSYGAAKITEEAIKTVELFYTVPCSNGGIQLEIHKDGYDIKIEVGPDGGIVSVMVVR